MAEPIDYYVAAIVDGIEQVSDSGLRDSGECALPLSKILSHYSKSKFVGYEQLLVNKKLLKEALDFLERETLIEIWKDDIAEQIVFIENPQKLYDSMEDNVPFQRLYMLKDNGHAWLSDAIAEVNKRQAPDASSKEEEVVNGPEEIIWEPLRIDRENDDFQSAVQATEEAIQAIEQDNGYAANLPDERNAILATAKGTVEALKEGTPSKEQVEVGLLKPLRYIAKKFGDSVVGALAKKAVEAIMLWLF